MKLRFEEIQCASRCQVHMFGPLHRGYYTGTFRKLVFYRDIPFLVMGTELLCFHGILQGGTGWEMLHSSLNSATQVLHTVQRAVYSALVRGLDGTVVCTGKLPCSF